MADFDKWPEPREFSAIEKDRLEYLNDDFFGNDQSERYKYPEFTQAMQQYASEISEYAQTAGISTERRLRHSTSPFEDLLNDCTDIFYDIGYAISYPDSPQKHLNCWAHFDKPLDLIRRKVTPRISRVEVEAAVGKYLKSPCRAQSLDRLLVDLMVATELFSFGEEVINPVYFPGLLSPPAHKASPLRDWLLGRMAMAVVCGVMFGIFCALSAMNIFPADWLVWPFVLAGGLFAADFVWTAVWLPFNCRKVSVHKKNVFDLLTAMSAVYSSLVSSGPISARNILREVVGAADKGVAWPAPLFALLDDILARGKTL
jgi:hypothetical protein